MPKHRDGINILFKMYFPCFTRIAVELLPSLDPHLLVEEIPFFATSSADISWDCGE